MRFWIGCGLLAFGALFLLGCSRDQSWTFHNGADLGDTPPHQLLAEVFDSPECGFGCDPPGDRVYCEILDEGQRGPPPTNLSPGRSYCFTGTAIDETGVAYAVGCAVAEVGGEPVDVPLSRLEERRAITRRCQQPMVMIDGGVDAGPSHRDAGSIDAGPAPVDAGPPRVDAGPGLPPWTPLTVYIVVRGPGQVRVTGLGINDTIYDRWTLQIEAYSGYQLRLDTQPDPGARLVGLTGGCGTADPCDVVLDRPETIDITFSAL